MGGCEAADGECVRAGSVQNPFDETASDFGSGSGPDRRPLRSKSSTTLWTSSGRKSRTRSRRLRSSLKTTRMSWQRWWRPRCGKLHRRRAGSGRGRVGQVVPCVVLPGRSGRSGCGVARASAAPEGSQGCLAPAAPPSAHAPLTNHAAPLHAIGQRSTSTLASSMTPCSLRSAPGNSSTSATRQST